MVNSRSTASVLPISRTKEATDFSFVRFLLACAIVAISLPPFLIPISGLYVPVNPAAILVAAALILYCAVFATTRKSYRAYTGLFIYIAVTVILISCIEIARGTTPAAVLTLFNFTTGTLGGILLGALWPRKTTKFSLLDYALFTFVVVSSCQIMLAYFELGGSLRVFHAQARLSWGASNYVAGVLVVACYFSGTRIRQVDASPMFKIIPAMGVIIAVGTLSRGALVAATVGLVIAIWRRASDSSQPLLVKSMAVMVIILGPYIYQHQTALRSTNNYDPSRNIEARVELFTLAVGEFFSSPLIGTGWLHLRQTFQGGAPISFAHNVIASFPQQSGIVGVVFVILLLLSIFTPMRNRLSASSASFSALAISLSDPFFETFVSSLIAWAAIRYAMQSLRQETEQM